MISKKSELLKLILIILIIVLFLALFILVFSWACYILPIDFPGTVGDWIAGLSALAGGALTLGGVWWTIKDQEDKRIKDLAIQYKPNLTLVNINNTKNNNFNVITILDHNFDLPDLFQQDTDKYSNEFIITFENTGRGNISNLQIKNELLDADPMIKKNIEILSSDKYHYLAKDNQLNLKLSFPLALFLKKDYIFIQPITIKNTISFYDEFHYMKYSYSILINIIFNKNDSITPSFKEDGEFLFFLSYELLNHSFYEQ